MASVDELRARWIEKRISWIQKVYLASAILACLALAVKAVIKGRHAEIVENVLPVLVFVCIYSGLRRRRARVIPLVLIISVLPCLSLFIVVLQPAAYPHMLMVKLFAVALFIFFAHQISFFAKREVASRFGYEGRVLF